LDAFRKKNEKTLPATVFPTSSIPYNTKKLYNFKVIQ